MRRSKRERAAFRKGWEAERDVMWGHNPYLNSYGYRNPYLTRSQYCLFARRGQEREFWAWERGHDVRVKWRERERQRLMDRFQRSFSGVEGE